MRSLFLGLVVCAIGSPAHADVVVDFTFSGQVFAFGDVPGRGKGGQLATAAGALTFDETGNAIPASQIFVSISGIPDIQTEIGLGGEDLYLNSFDVSPNGEFLGGKFAYATLEGFGGPASVGPPEDRLLLSPVGAAVGGVMLGPPPAVR